VTTRLPIELPALEDLPQTYCDGCGKNKINGLFSPGELKNPYGRTPRCMVCLGEANAKARANRTGAWRNLKGEHKETKGRSRLPGS
jgi:hypothetical protein